MTLRSSARQSLEDFKAVEAADAAAIDQNTGLKEEKHDQVSKSKTNNEKTVVKRNRKGSKTGISKNTNDNQNKKNFEEI